MEQGAMTQPGSAREIQRADLPSRDAFYRDHDTQRIPTIFLNGMTHWRAMSQWTFDWFKSTHRDVVVPVNTGRYDVRMTRKAMSLGQYVDSLFAPDRPYAYLSNVNLFRWIPSLAADVTLPPYEWLRFLNVVNFWMAAKGTVTQLHRDFGHNLIGQITGKKRFQLYSPSVSERLFPANTTWSASFSQLDFERPDPEKIAAARDVHPDFDFVLERGEMLFLPYGWWHRVTTLEPAINVNLWWWTSDMLARHGPRFALDVFTSLLLLPPALIRYWWLKRRGEGA
jgi:hypothetical protein